VEKEPGQGRANSCLRTQLQGYNIVVVSIVKRILLEGYSYSERLFPQTKALHWHQFMKMAGFGPFYYPIDPSRDNIGQL